MIEVLVDLGEVVDVSLVDPLLVVQSLSFEVQLGQILKVCTNAHMFQDKINNFNHKVFPVRYFTFSKNFMTFFMLSPLPVKRGESMSRPTILEY